MLKSKYSEQKFKFSKDQIQKLSKLRIIQKNLVHFQGFPDTLNSQNLLLQNSHFGKFGKILKIVLVSKNEESNKKKTNSAYITFSKIEEAANAILSMDSLIIENCLVRAFFGTTKYCFHFLNNNECKNKEKCMFIHYIANDNDIIGMNSKFDYNDHLKLAQQIITFSLYENNKKLIMEFNSFKNYNPNVKKKNFKDDLFDESNINYPLIRKNSTSSSNSTNNSDININNMRNKQNENFLFKYKDESRFFCNNNIKNNNYNINISDPVKKLIDCVCNRIGFFTKYENNKELEIKLYKKKFEFINDSFINQVFENTF